MDSKPAVSLPVMLQAIDDSNTDVLDQITELIGDLEDLKAHVIRNSDALKDYTTRHFNIGAEALGFCDVVRTRMHELANTPAVPIVRGEPDLAPSALQTTSADMLRRALARELGVPDQETDHEA